MDTQELNLDESGARELLRYVFGEYISGMVISNYIDGFKITKQSIKKEYEILSFIHDGHLLLRSEKQPYTFGSAYHVENEALQFAKIYSVKRILDGEIFSIGDLVNGNNKIERFSIRENRGTLSAHTPAIYQLSRLKKDPKFNWAVYTNDGIDRKAFAPYKIESGSCESNDSTWQCFETEQEAKDFIIQNKPCFSAKDVNFFIFLKKSGFSDQYVNNAIDFSAKEKLFL
jgi:hypothetical protein